MYPQEGLSRQRCRQEAYEEDIGSPKVNEIELSHYLTDEWAVLMRRFSFRGTLMLPIALR